MTEESRYDAVILGAGRAPWLLPYAGTDIRVLARLGGRRFLDYLLDALAASGKIRRTLLAVNAEIVPDLTQGTQLEVLAGGADIAATCLVAARYLATPNAKILFLCDDIPLVTGAAIADFLEQCERVPSGELYYPIVRKEICLARYPQAKRTFSTVKNGSFTGGNMMLVASNVIERGQAQAAELYARRKKPWQLVSWLGWRFFFKLITGQIDTAAAERRMTQLMQMDSRIIISDFPEVAMDIDKAADWQLLTQLQLEPRATFS